MLRRLSACAMSVLCLLCAGVLNGSPDPGSGAQGGDLDVLYPNDSWPVWSPDGASILFASDRHPKNLKARPISSLYRIAVAGDKLAQLLPYYDLSHPAYSPDGKWLVFTAGAHIYVMEIATGQRRKLTLRERDGYEPCWMPDGERILFISWRTGRDADRFVVRRDADPNTAGSHRRFAEINGIDAMPVCSPDATKIAFVHEDRQSHNLSEIWVMNVDGTNAHKVYRCPAWIGRISWFPDSQRLFVQLADREEGRSFDVPEMHRVVTVSTGECRTLPFPIDHPIHMSDDAVISPDGKTIAFSSIDEQMDGAFIFTCRLDGSKLVRLTSPL